MGAYIDRNMNLSEHFKLYEMLISETAERKGIQNNPSYYNVENLKGLCVNVGEPIRAYVRKDIKKNAVITVSSGFRSPALNKETSIWLTWLLLNGLSTISFDSNEPFSIRRFCNGNKKGKLLSKIQPLTLFPPFRRAGEARNPLCQRSYGS